MLEDAGMLHNVEVKIVASKEDRRWQKGGVFKEGRTRLFW
jgi:hypothetical protein